MIKKLATKHWEEKYQQVDTKTDLFICFFGNKKLLHVLCRGFVSTLKERGKDSSYLGGVTCGNMGNEFGLEASIY